MVLRTPFTRSMSVQHPIASAPMGGSAGGALAAAVSNGGGLGLVGGGRGERDWLVRELALVAGLTTEPWGVGFQTWALDADTVAQALEFRPAAVMLAFGDPAPFADQVRAAGAKLILQVTDLEEARHALAIGADVIVAQGSEAGGHSGQSSVATMSFVPSVVDLAGPTPVLAAGGIADGRGLATGSSTSPAVLHGRTDTRPAPCATRSSTPGATVKANFVVMRRPDRRTARRRPAMTSTSFPSGPARPSISSRPSNPPGTSSPHSQLRPSWP
jgi:nitronate monooxygenase